MTAAGQAPAATERSAMQPIGRWRVRRRMTMMTPMAMTTTRGRAGTLLALLAGTVLLGACSSSFGSGGGSAPQKTYVVLPNGTTEPVQTTTQPPPGQ